MFSDFLSKIYLNKSAMLALIAVCAVCTNAGTPGERQCSSSSSEKSVVVKSAPKKKGFWNFLFHSGKSKFIAVLASIFLILAIVAIFYDGTGMNENFGRNVFQDEGASQYLRLALIIPTFTFILGAIAVNYTKWKYLPSSPQQLQQYQKCGGEWYKVCSTKKLIANNEFCTVYFGLFSFMMIVLGMSFMVMGHANFDNTMFWFAVGPLCLFGVIGMTGAGINGVLLRRKRLQIHMVNEYFDRPVVNGQMLVNGDQIRLRPSLNSLTERVNVQDQIDQELLEERSSSKDSRSNPLSEMLNKNNIGIEL